MGKPLTAPLKFLIISPKELKWLHGIVLTYFVDCYAFIFNVRIVFGIGIKY